MEWSFSSIAHVLVGSSITVAGMILGATLLGAPPSNASFLLSVTIILVIMGMTVIIFESQNKEGQKPPESP
jgi:hypothetical protein